MNMDAGLPVELRAYRPLVEVGGTHGPVRWQAQAVATRGVPEPRPSPFALQQYVLLRLQSFAHLFARRLGAQLTPEQVDYLVHETMATVNQMQEPPQQMPQQSLRLVLRHDCQ